LNSLPDFLIIGVQRGGTSSLYNYLISHPKITPATQKEIHFFDYNFHKGVTWYKSQFKKEGICGEASPYYIFHPHAPKRIVNLIPTIKMIILLRNPVDRAYSHYNHELRLGIENLPIEDAIKQESKRLDNETKKIIADESYYSFNHQHFSYLTRGIYVEQLKKWITMFSKEQILLIKSEDFFQNPLGVTNNVFNFLELEPLNQIPDTIFNRNTNPPMKNEMREYLNEYFRIPNQRLYKLIGKNFGWQ